MNKLICLAIVFLLFFVNIFSQPTKIAQNEGINKSSQQDQLNFQNRIIELEKKVSDLQDSIKINKIHYDVANRIYDKSDNIISWSGWIGLLVTALLVALGIYSYFSFSSSKQEINLLLKDANARLSEAENKFNSFINSPEKINELFENLNFKQIEKEIDSNDEKVFIQGLTRANVLSEKMKIILAQRIKSKLFDRHFYWMHFYHIYSFLQENLPRNTLIEIATRYFDQFKDNIRPEELYKIMYDIFGEYPYSVKPFDFYKEIGNDNNSIAFSHFTKLLNENDLYELVGEMITKEFLPPNINLLRKDKLTNVVTINIEKISKDTLDNIINHLDFSEPIFLRRLNESKESFRYDKYIINCINSKNILALLLNNIDLDKKDNWINLFDLPLMQLKEKDRIEVLYGKYKNIELPNDDFFINDLPLLFQPNYGIKKNNSEYKYGNQVLSISETCLPIDDKMHKTVIHPLLIKAIEIEKIN